MAALSLATQQVDLKGGGVIVAAAVIANWFESVLGASIQGDVEFLTNDVINMIQITVAAGVAMGLYSGIGAVFV
ncbi:hypothetical protein CYMTET_10011 [Cymbomonas tetramitiformis]|uniref:Uncharacterized protein n=1 Tax=Cymbomonas tetramitiformis TaxID=36881 RepID=A0AAE0GQA3_9CHLO|nr:hypothetical protein CYMTET_10011 [Cymbomonas tetramitiformis]